MIESIGVREMKMLKEVMNVSFLRVVTVKEPLNTLLEVNLRVPWHFSTLPINFPPNE